MLEMAIRKGAGMGFWRELIDGVRWFMSENLERDIELGLIRREFGTAALLNHLDPDRILRIVGAYYRSRGAILRWVSRPEGGSDLVAYHYTGEVDAVLVRHRTRITCGDLQDLIAAKRRHKASKAIIYTTEPRPVGQLGEIISDFRIEVKDGNQIANILDDLDRRQAAH